MFARLMGLTSISPGDLHVMIGDGTATAIDVNSPQSWSNARVPGAISLDPVRFDQSHLPDDKSSTVVFYCSNIMCRKAPNAAKRAKKMGYSDVRVMLAGISGWLSAKLPTESGPGA